VQDKTYRRIAYAITTKWLSNSYSPRDLKRWAKNFRQDDALTERALDNVIAAAEETLRSDWMKLWLDNIDVIPEVADQFPTKLQKGLEEDGPMRFLGGIGAASIHNAQQGMRG